eukprot:3106425-Pleurochrysis_carterae.AAC.1
MHACACHACCTLISVTTTHSHATTGAFCRLSSLRLDEGRHAHGGERIQGDQGRGDRPPPLHRRGVPSLLWPAGSRGLLQPANPQRSGRAEVTTSLRLRNWQGQELQEAVASTRPRSIFATASDQLGVPPALRPVPSLSPPPSPPPSPPAASTSGNDPVRELRRQLNISHQERARLERELRDLKAAAARHGRRDPQAAKIAELQNNMADLEAERQQLLRVKRWSKGMLD